MPQALGPWLGQGDDQGQGSSPPWGPSASTKHAWNELSENRMEETIPFTTASKTGKFLETNLTKKAEEVYNKNVTTLMEETEDTNTWKEIHLHGSGEFRVFKCPH